MSKSINPESGFSLIEVLGALLVTMLLVLTLSPFVSQMLSTWARGGEVAGIVEFQTRGLGRLRDDLRHSLVWTGYGEISDLASFEGDESSMNFPVAAGLGPNRLGIEYVSLSVVPTGDGRALVRRRAPVIGSSYGAFADPVVLISGPFKYVFKYYSRDGEETPEWSKSRFDVPGQIKLDIVDRNGVSLFGVPIVISTFSSLSAGCFAAGSLQGCSATEKAPTYDDILKGIGMPTEQQE
jgi:general secretion pathway protein J